MAGPAYRWRALAAFGLFSALTQGVSAAEPCEFLTVQEIGQVLGASVAPPMPMGTTGCLWKSGSQSVSISVRPATAWARITMPGPGITKTDVSGLGESSSLSSMGNGDALTLSVKHGATIIILTVSGVMDSARTRAAEE